jgi:DNA repair exonuclease
MKILMYADSHFTKKTSNLPTNCYLKYTIRLDKLIDTFSWIKDVAINNNVDMIIGLGDLTNNANPSSYTNNAIKEALAFLNSIGCYVYSLVGNHDKYDHMINSQAIFDFDLTKNKIFDKSNFIQHFRANEDISCLFLPYSNYSVVQMNSIKKFITKVSKMVKELIIFSHLDYIGNDFISEDRKDLLSRKWLRQFENVKVFNGHIHNRLIDHNYCQVGSVFGSNFTDNYGDGNKNLPSVCVYDTNDNRLDFLNNPHSINFYTLAVESEENIKDILNSLERISNLFSLNYKVTSGAIAEHLKEKMDYLIKQDMLPNLIKYKITMQSDISDLNKETQKIELRSKKLIDILFEYVNSDDSLTINKKDMIAFLTKYKNQIEV